MKTHLLILAIILILFSHFSEQLMARQTNETLLISIHHGEENLQSSIHKPYVSQNIRCNEQAFTIDTLGNPLKSNRLGDEYNCSGGTHFIQRKYHSQVFDHLYSIDDCLEKPGMLQKVRNLTFNMTLFTGNVLDSVIYHNSGQKYKEFFTYNEKAKRLTYLKQYWYTTSNDWTNEWRYTYTYDVSGNMLSEFYEVWDNNAEIWVDSKHETYTYDGRGNMIIYFYEEWDSNAEIWETLWRHFCTYDGSGNILSHLFEEWYPYDEIWINKTRETYTYDDSGNMLTHLYEEWDGNVETWVNSKHETYTYDGGGNIITYLWDYWDSNAEIWINLIRYNYTYDGNGNMLTYLWEYWDRNAEIWVNEGRETYTYDGSGNMPTLFRQYWDRNAEIWVNSKRYTLTYDVSGSMLTHFYQQWDIYADLWDNVWRKTYTYDGDGNLIHFMQDWWFGSSWICADGSCKFDNCEYDYSYRCKELFAYYSPLTRIDSPDNNVINSYSLSQNYPNPFNPSTKIKFDLPKSETVKIDVYNIIGQKIQTLLNKPMPTGYHEVEFNGQNLSSGIYLYRIKAGAWQDVKKMVLLH